VYNIVCLHDFPGEGYFYVKEEVISEGDGSGESYHELGKVGEESGYKTGSTGATDYKYEGKLESDGTTTKPASSLVKDLMDLIGVVISSGLDQLLVIMKRLSE